MGDNTSDIVERLRVMSFSFAGEAADEIERLRKALESERERCARIAEDPRTWRPYSGTRPDRDAIAMAIRDAV
jgi:hypothetical protein